MGVRRQRPESVRVLEAADDRPGKGRGVLWGDHAGRVLHQVRKAAHRRDDHGLSESQGRARDPRLAVEMVIRQDDQIRCNEEPMDLGRRNVVENRQDVVVKPQLPDEAFVWRPAFPQFSGDHQAHVGSGFQDFGKGLQGRIDTFIRSDGSEQEGDLLLGANAHICSKGAVAFPGPGLEIEGAVGDPADPGFRNAVAGRELMTVFLGMDDETVPQGEKRAGRRDISRSGFVGKHVVNGEDHGLFPGLEPGADRHVDRCKRQAPPLGVKEFGPGPEPRLNPAGGVVPGQAAAYRQPGMKNLRKGGIVRQVAAGIEGVGIHLPEGDEVDPAALGHGGGQFKAVAAHAPERRERAQHGDGVYCRHSRLVSSAHPSRQ